MAWTNGFARSLGVSTALLVTKAVEEFAATRGYKVAPQRYEKAKFFDQITGEWVDELPYSVGYRKPRTTPTDPAPEAESPPAESEPSRA